MLLELAIKNFILIDHLNLSFKNGFTIFTGETGTGKSILIDAINLICGERADTSLIRSDAETCTVEALINIEKYAHVLILLDESGISTDNHEEIFIRREISRTGKNRCWINHQLTPLSLLQDITGELIDLHGQHEHQSLLKRLNNWICLISLLTLSN